MTPSGGNARQAVFQCPEGTSEGADGSIDLRPDGLPAVVVDKPGGLGAGDGSV